MNIYVGNLDWNMTSEDLFELFTPYGEVGSAKIITDKLNNNRSKGFGFVEMADDEAAKKAIAELHDTEINRRRIVVNESAPKEGGGGEGGGYKKKPFGSGGSGGGFNRDRGGSGGGGGYNRDRGGYKGNRGGGDGGNNSGGGYGRY